MKTTVNYKSKYWSLCLLSIGIQSSSAEDRPASLTVYNQNFAVIRQTVPIKLNGKVSKINFSGVTAQVWPDSVVLRDPKGKALFRILEQNYRNDPISQSLLLKQFEGKTIDFEVRQGDNFSRKKGTVIRSGFVPGGRSTEPIIQLDVWRLSLVRSLRYFSRMRASDGWNGMVRSLRPFPSFTRTHIDSRSTSSSLRLMSSDLRIPVEMNMAIMAMALGFS